MTAAKLCGRLAFKACGFARQVSMSMPKDPPLPGAGRPPKKTDAAFDIWLQKSLHQMYDDVASEPIPDNILRLIEEDRPK